MGRDEVGSPPKAVPESLLLAQLEAEVRRQDAKHGPFEGSRLGRSRLALACLEDEVREALQAWRDERKAPAWDEVRAEVLQVAAVAFRALRDAFPPEGLERKRQDDLDAMLLRHERELGGSNRVG